jgi:hypothetical protein
VALGKTAESLLLWTLRSSSMEVSTSGLSEGTERMVPFGDFEEGGSSCEGVKLLLFMALEKNRDSAGAGGT